MGETHPPSDAAHAPDETDLRAELRTIGFRMREIQRLLAVRVEQENRRLEAAGLEPVPQARFLERGSEDADDRP